MKISKDFLIHKSGEDTLLVPTGKAKFSGLVRGNKTFGAVLDLLGSNEGGVTEEQIVSAMKERFDAPQETIERDVKKALTELRRIGAVED